MSPKRPSPTCSGRERVILTLSDPGLEPCPQNSHRGKAIGPLESVERLGHLPGREPWSSGMPSAGSADPVTNDGPGFHSNCPRIDSGVPVSELTEPTARANEARGPGSPPLASAPENHGLIGIGIATTAVGLLHVASLQEHTRHDSFTLLNHIQNQNSCVSINLPSNLQKSIHGHLTQAPLG